MAAGTERAVKKISRRLPPGIVCRTACAPEVPAQVLLFETTGLQAEEIYRIYIIFYPSCTAVDKILASMEKCSPREASYKEEIEKIQGIAGTVFDQEGFLKDFTPGKSQEAIKQLTQAEDRSLLFAFKGLIDSITGHLPEGSRVWNIEPNASTRRIDIHFAHNSLGHLGSIRLKIICAPKDLENLCLIMGRNLRSLQFEVVVGYSNADDEYSHERKAMMAEVSKTVNEALTRNADGKFKVSMDSPEETVCMASDFYEHPVGTGQGEPQGDLNEIPPKEPAYFEEDIRHTIEGSLRAPYSLIEAELSKMSDQIHMELSICALDHCATLSFVRKDIGGLGSVKILFNELGVSLESMRYQAFVKDDGFDDERRKLMGGIFKIVNKAFGAAG
jgi:hypothetical protein